MKNLPKLTWTAALLLTALATAWLLAETAPPTRPAASANTPDDRDDALPPVRPVDFETDERQPPRLVSPSDLHESDEPQAQPTPEQSPVPGRQLLQLVRQKLIDYQPFRADIRQTVVVGPRKFRVTGRYFQGQDLRLRLELSVRVGTTQAERLDVCDGQVLFSQVRVGQKVRVTRRDVKQILRTAVAHVERPQNLLVAELGLGGLSGLLAAVERSMTLQPVRTETVQGRRLLVVEGTWSESWRKKLNELAEKGSDRLPEYVPDAVRIYVDQAYFPRRFLYLKAGPEGLLRPMATLDFTGVVLRTYVPEDTFRFVPPEGILPVDITDRFLEELTASPDDQAGSADSPDGG